ncbi:MAG TPA: LPS export ABC transporter periplasmic protein LptC [bacterium]|nr:LPS export ABC transporter periplasmic protein LptC [bacterium]
MKRLLFFVAFMTLGTAALIELMVRVPVGPTRVTRPAPQATNVLNMSGVTVHQLVGEQTRWQLEAGKATYNENTNIGQLEGVRFQVFDTQPGQPAREAFSGHSGEAELSAEPGDVVLQGSVVLSKGSEMEIRSERIEYDATTQTVSSPGPVTVRTPQGVQEGAAMRYSIPDDRIEFTSPLFYQ